MTLKKMFRDDYIFSLFAKILSVAIGMVYTILYSRYLGSELRGVASVILNYADIIMLILCFGIYQSYPYFRRNKTASYTQYVNNILALFLLYLAIAIVVVLSFGITSQVAIVAILVPVMMATRQFYYLVMIERPKLKNLYSILIEVFDVLFVAVLLLFTEANYLICILFLILKNTVALIISFANLRVKPRDIHPTFKGMMPALRYGIIPMITLMLMEVNYKIAIIMLEWFSVPNKDIGVYSLGIMLAQKLWIIPDALKDVLTSKLSKGKSVEEVSRITRISLWAVTACVAVVLTIGRPMIPLIFGQEYSGAYAVFLSIMVGIIGMVFYKMIYAYNVVNGRRKNNFICLCLTCITSVVLNCFTIPQYGILGAGVATTISYTLCGICFLVDFCKITGSRPATLLLIQKEDLQLLKKILRR